MIPTLILILLLAPYAVAVGLCSFRFVAGVRELRIQRKGERAACGITIVICVADADAAGLANSLPQLYTLLGSDDSIIVVADHVGEGALALLRNAAECCGPRLRVLENDGQQGKKHAQRLGVEAAETDVVVSIDADCTVGGGFLDVVRREVCALGGRDFMLLLPVEMRGDGSLFGRLVELEFGCLQVVTAGTAFLGRPTMANGAGMAFGRSLYLEHDSRVRYASGDDMFLLAHALRKGADVRYVADSEVLVSTSAPASLTAYLRQRTRWLAKAGGYRSVGVIALALVVFGAVVAWPIGVLCACLGVCSWGIAGFVFCSKLVVDGLACGAWLWFRRGLRGLSGLWVAVPLEVVYPVMTVVVALRAAVAPRGRW